ncbi:hypothetical protein, partial [Halomicronema sp. CCY15110]|uniref:hypothetical protein n=1 Tax=Halomicronema sp. CCY15110 TaxID=2767773 RepID=UPI00195116BE
RHPVPGPDRAAPSPPAAVAPLVRPRARQPEMSAFAWGGETSPPAAPLLTQGEVYGQVGFGGTAAHPAGASPYEGEAR